jgi:hypothetical protein
MLRCQADDDIDMDVSSGCVLTRDRVCQQGPLQNSELSELLLTLTPSLVLITGRRTPCMPCLISFRPPSSSTTLHASPAQHVNACIYSLPLFRIDTQCICLALSPLLASSLPSLSHIYIRHGQGNRSIGPGHAQDCQAAFVQCGARVRHSRGRGRRQPLSTACHGIPRRYFLYIHPPF